MDARHAGEMNAMRAIVLVSFSFVSRMEFYKNCKCLIMTVWRREAKNENGKFYYKLMKVGEQRASTHHHHPSASPEKFQIYYVLGRKEIFTKKKKQRERYTFLRNPDDGGIYIWKARKEFLMEWRRLSCAAEMMSLVWALSRPLTSIIIVKLKNYFNVVCGGGHLSLHISLSRDWISFNFNDCKVTQRENKIVARNGIHQLRWFVGDVSGHSLLSPMTDELRIRKFQRFFPLPLGSS